MNEFTSPNTLQAPLLICCRATANTSVAQAMSRWKMCTRSLLKAKRSATKLAFTRVSEESLRRGNRCVHRGFTDCVHRSIWLLRCELSNGVRRNVIRCCIADSLFFVCTAAQSVCALPRAAFAGCSGRSMRRSKRRVLISMRRWQKLFGESNDGPICGCHHCSDSFYRGDGVFGRVDHVRGRFDG